VNKLAYFFLTLVGAIPAGGALYALVMNLFDRADKLGGLLLGVTITAAVCMLLVTLTPLIVLFGYKDTRPKPEPGAATAAEPATAAAGAAAAAPGFDDAIPEDFDENELAATADSEYGDGEYEEAEYDEGEFDDFDLEEDA